METWLDSPARAKREFLCHDGLPEEWQELERDDYLLESILWYEAQIAGRHAALTGDGSRVREVAVMELMEAADDIVERHEATYPAFEGFTDEQEELEGRLLAMYDELVEPHDLGFRPPPWQETSPSDPAPLRGPPIRPQAGVGVAIVDPVDLAELTRITRSWHARENLLRDDLDAARDEVWALGRRIGATDDPDELAFLLREARRADARLECALSDLARFEDDVRTYDPGNRFVNRLLEQGYRQNRVISLDRDQAEVVARGRAGGGTGAGGSGGSTGAPGRWIAGLAGADERIAELQSADPGGGQSAGTPAGDPGGPPQAGRWVERRYEGPLPEPTGPWDPGLLAALRDHQPALDDVDVAVLLQLIELAFAELPDRTAVEGAVWRSLSIPGGLELFGQESQLSELLADAYDSGEQPEIVFVLRLWI